MMRFARFFVRALLTPLGGICKTAPAEETRNKNQPCAAQPPRRAQKRKKFFEILNFTENVLYIWKVFVLLRYKLF